MNVDFARTPAMPEAQADGCQRPRVNPLLEKESPWVESGYSNGPWKLVQCQRSGFVYLQNPPGYAALSSEYAWEKSLEQQTQERRTSEPLRAKFSASIKRVRKAIHRRDKMAQEAVSLLGQMPKMQRRLRVVDIGCGEGRHGGAIAQKAIDDYSIDVQPIGVEISEAAAVVARQRFYKFGGDVLHQPALEALETLDDESIECIIMNSFLEHELNPGPLLRLCGKKLATHGVILIKVPNFDCWNRKIRQHRWCGFRHPDHVNYFTPATFRALVERNCLVIKRMNWRDCLPTNDNMWAVLSI